LGKSISKIKNRPVLEPLVFHDDCMQGWTVVHRRRWSPAFGKKVLDPELTPGLTRSWADGNVTVARRGPATIVHHDIEATKQSRPNEKQFMRVEVGEAVVGSLLGKSL
jgi:hypothetical protein